MLKLKMEEYIQAWVRKNNPISLLCNNNNPKLTINNNNNIFRGNKNSLEFQVVGTTRIAAPKHKIMNLKLTGKCFLIS